ncbi:MAG: hypothetical protein QOJ65_457 [Fimbriimonadaceae bacterium]|nr:hypothetical protein [Fimbriimonadaceae bacterium]
MAGTIWVLGACIILFLLAFIWKGWDSDATHAAIGLVLGAIGTTAARSVPRAGRLLASIALAAACSGLLLWAPAEWRLLAQLGAIAGAALASWLLEVRSASLVSSAIFPISLAAIVAVDALGAKAMAADAFTSSGTVLGVAAAAAGVLALLASLRGVKSGVQQIIGVALLALAGVVVGYRYLGTRDAWILFVAGVVLAVVVNWFMDDESDDSLRPLIAAVMWIGLATVAFALRRGYGMSLSLLGGTSTLLLLGNSRGLLTLGPLAGLVMYRVFREEHVNATRALDIGQHYALVGLAIGALLPLLPTEWLKGREAISGPRLPSAAVLWLVLVTAAPMGIAIVMGPKGVVGFVAGLGFSALLESIRYTRSLQPLSLGLGLSAATTIVFRFLGDNTSMTREEKIGILLPLAGALAVLVIVLLIVSPRPTVQEAEAQ